MDKSFTDSNRNFTPLCSQNPGYIRFFPSRTVLTRFVEVAAIASQLQGEVL